VIERLPIFLFMRPYRYMECNNWFWRFVRDWKDIIGYRSARSGNRLKMAGRSIVEPAEESAQEARQPSQTDDTHWRSQEPSSL